MEAILNLDSGSPPTIHSAPEELFRRLTATSRLLDVVRRLALAVDLADTLQVIADEASQSLDCERASLFQFDRKSETLFTRACTELEIPEIRKRVGEGIVGWAAMEGTTLVVPDPAAEPRWDASTDRATGFQTRNLLAAPILAPHTRRLLGVLQLVNKRDRPFEPFDRELVEAFCQHAAAAIERGQLIEEIRSQQELRASLEVARQVQRTFMPSVLPAIPGYEAATWWFPNEAIGGDYCDVVSFPDGRWGLVIADVSGHGLGPSLIMASVRAGLRTLLLEHSAPGVCLRQLGQALSGDLQDGRFITMFLGALDAAGNQLQFANAGHGPALHYRKRTGEFLPLEATGLPLGVLERPEYPQSGPLEIEPGDLVVLCTDGIVEAINEFNQQFGLQRLCDLLRTLADEPLDALVQAIGREVSSHYVGESPPDDLTVLALRRS